MKVKIDPELCIGCGLCTELVPEVFELKENNNGIVSIVKDSVDFVDKKVQVKVKEAAMSCPSEAIKLGK